MYGIFLRELTIGPWGSIASIVGLLITLIGFLVTIRLAWRSKNAAELAQEEVVNVRRAIVQSWTIADFSSAISVMNEIKRLHRVEAWPMLPDRYAELRKMLISIRSMNPDMPDDHKTIFQSALQHCSNCENNVEKWLRHKDKRPDPARFNAVFSKEVDKLSEILEDIKQNVGN